MPTKVNLPDGRVVNFPDGMSPADIEKALGDVQQPSQPQAAPSGPGVLQTVANFVKQHPAELGAIAGGLAAVPLTGGASLLPAMAAAGLGGAGGAGLGMIAGAAAGSPVPNSPYGVLQTMATQGAGQAVAEGGGRLISGALKAGAGRLYQSVLKPTYAARTEYPNLVETGLKNAVPVSQSGAEKGAKLMAESRDAATQMVSDAQAANPSASIDPTNVVANGLAPAVDRLRQLQVARPGLKAAGDYARDYLAEHPGTLTLPQAQATVRAENRALNGAYRAALDQGDLPLAGRTAAEMGLANATRQELAAQVPGLAGQNANTQALAGLQEAVARRAGQQGNNSVVGMQHFLNAGLGGLTGAYTGDYRGKGLGTFLGLEALTNPAIASQIAIRGYQAGRIPAQQLIRAAMLAGLANQDQPGGGGQ